MERNMDVVRKIILTVRGSAGPVSGIEGIAPQIFAYHAQILDEAGLVAAATQGSDKRPAIAAIVFRLTWAGQDFADSIIDDTLWNKAKEKVIKPSAAWTFSILLEYLRAEIKRHIPGLDQLP